MGQIKLYANGGSRNHGCEAILRSTKKILDKNMCVYSIAQNEDLENKINEIMEIKENRNEKKAIYMDEIWRLIGVTSNKNVARHRREKARSAMESRFM